MNSSQESSSGRSSGAPQELAGLLGEIDQDRSGIEDARLAAAWPIRVHDGRHLAVRIDRAEGRRVLFALASVDGDRLIGEACLFQKQCDLRRVRRRVKIETDHGAFPSRYDDWGMAGRRAASSTPATMIAIAAHSMLDGVSPSTGMARSEATAGSNAMIAVRTLSPPTNSRGWKVGAGPSSTVAQHKPSRLGVEVPSKRCPNLSRARKWTFRPSATSQHAS